jgi:hypothetical protein
VAGVTRLELATSCVTGRRSNQLSYTPKIKDWRNLNCTLITLWFVTPQL